MKIRRILNIKIHLVEWYLLPMTTKHQYVGNDCYYTTRFLCFKIAYVGSGINFNDHIQGF
jgi:hypothetical protein